MGLGSLWEVSLGDTSVDGSAVSAVGGVGRRWHLSLNLLSALSNVLRCNIGVFSGVSLDGLGSFASLLGRQITELLCLLDGDIGNVLVLRVDQLFVLSVDERDEEGDTGSE